MRANRAYRAEIGLVGAVIAGLLFSLVVPAPARGQENPNPDQWHKMYDDLLKELKSAQERKNQLVEENDKLKGKIEDLNKQLASVNGQLAQVKREQADEADKTFYLRSHYAAWEAFLRQYPELLGRWKVFMESDFLSPRRGSPPIIDEEWPTSVES